MGREALHKTEYMFVFLIWGCGPYPEVIHSNCQGIHDLSINGLILKVNEVHFFSDGL